MLLLTRRVGESIYIGNDITVTVMGVRGMLVQLGIDAPRSIKVYREEVFQRIQAEELALANKKPQEEPETIPEVSS